MSRLLLLLAMLGPAALSAQILELVADPSTARLFRVVEGDSVQLIPIGVGRATLKLERNSANAVLVRHDGYRDERRSYPKEAEYPIKRFTIALTRRVVTVTARPADATIVVNSVPRAAGRFDVEVEQGKTTTVEVTRPGFAPERRRYAWTTSTDSLPERDEVALAVRRVSVIASPGGARVVVGSADPVDGPVDVAVPRGTCVEVRVQKPGWMPVDRSYCHGDGLPDPPVADRVALMGRMVALAAPIGARVIVNGKVVGSGPTAVPVPAGSCTRVQVDQPGFFTIQREYCMTPNAAAEPPVEDPVELVTDDSFAASRATDQANVAVTIECSPRRSEAQAWKLLASIVLSHFDVLENSDSETGYLRTAWAVKSFYRAEGGVPERLVRTRVIVKRTSESPLRYTVKLVSERSRTAGGSPKDDELFEPWDRLLNSYADVIAELQARLK